MGLKKLFRKIVAPFAETAIGVVNPVAGIASKLVGDQVLGSPSASSGKTKYDPAAVSTSVTSQLEASAPTTAVNPTGELILAGLAGLGILLAMRHKATK